MKCISNQTFDEERALYGQKEIHVTNCRFDGPADGESAFKEGTDITAEYCFFNLRYPFWHDTNLTIRDGEMTEFCRAALWYPLLQRKSASGGFLLCPSVSHLLGTGRGRLRADGVYRQGYLHPIPG